MFNVSLLLNWFYWRYHATHHLTTIAVSRAISLYIIWFYKYKTSWRNCYSVIQSLTVKNQFISACFLWEILKGDKLVFVCVFSWFLVQCAGSKLWLFRIKYLSPYWSEITNTRIKNLALSVLVYSFIDEVGIVAFYVTELAILFFLLTSAQRLSNL